MTTLTLTTSTFAPAGALVAPAGRRHRRPAGRPAPLHLTRRGRLVVILLGVAVLFGGTLAATGALADGPAGAPQVRQYVVSPGDTLWAIAATVVLPGQDVRDVVLDIERLNGMSSAALVAGQELVLPVAG